MPNGFVKPKLPTQRAVVATTPWASLVVRLCRAPEAKAARTDLPGEGGAVPAALPRHRRRGQPGRARALRRPRAAKRRTARGDWAGYAIGMHQSDRRPGRPQRCVHRGWCLRRAGRAGRGAAPASRGQRGGTSRSLGCHGSCGGAGGSGGGSRADAGARAGDDGAASGEAAVPLRIMLQI